MCGRYILAQPATAEKTFGLARQHWTFTPSYNVGPTREVPVIRVAQSGEREGVMMRWGLIPPFLKGESPKYPTHNASLETMEASPAFREAWKRGQRCIVPAQGYYEWQLLPDAPKQPWCVALADNEMMPFAGLWERSVKADRTVVESVAIVTLPADGKRVPAILRMEDVELWLTGPPEAAKAALRPLADGTLRRWKVSPRVNLLKNDDEQLMAAS